MVLLVIDELFALPVTEKTMKLHYVDTVATFTTVATGIDVLSNEFLL